MIAKKCSFFNFMSTLVPMFKICDLVLVDEISKACVTNTRGDINSSWFLVRNCVTNSEENNTFQDRCAVATLL